MVSFVNWTCEYLIVYVVFIAAIITAFFIGSSLRKRKNAKESAETTTSDNEKVK